MREIIFLNEDTIVDRDIKLYTLSKDNLDNKTLQPRVPDNFLIRNGYEDNITKRVCFATSIGKCLTALSTNNTNTEFYVHIPDPNKKYKVYEPSIKKVPDVKITNEHWIKEPVKLKCIGKILCIKDAGKDGIKYKYGDKEAELYEWEWKWLEKENYD